MTIPVRLRHRRVKGFNLQEHSRAVNGQPAVLCTRPGKWGNCYVIGRRNPETGEPVTREEAVRLYRLYVEPHRSVVRECLAGKNLACTCGPDQACHVDVLLELANAPEEPTPP